MSSKFTEEQTESYYDSEDAIYRSFWDEEGSVHWGFFEDGTTSDFMRACSRLDHLMVEKGRIGENSRVLDLGCGNGTTAIWISDNKSCHVTGVDLSGVRVANAKEARARKSADSQARLAFEKASATDLPFADKSFTHLWSQAVIYHVPDKRAVLKEAYRVLEDGGIMVFDDLVKPKPEVSAEAQEFVFDRLLFDTEFSFESYQEALKAVGFEVLEAHDISNHLRLSYLSLAERTPKNSLDHSEHYRWLTNAYIETARAVDNNDLGWGLYVCRK